MIKRNLLLLFGAMATTVPARVIRPTRVGMTQLSDIANQVQHVPVELEREQQMPRNNMAPMTTAAATIETIAIYDPQSRSSVVSSASVVDSNVVEESIQNEPTGGSHYSGPVTFSQPVSLPAVVESLTTSDGSTTGWATISSETVVVYDPITVYIDVPTAAPYANATASATSVPAVTTPTAGPSNGTTMTTHSNGLATTTPKWQHWTGNGTITPTPDPATATGQPAKRQICSLIYAEINGVWESWCNNWDGSQVLTYTSWTSTTTLTSVMGADPPPESVVHPSTSTTTSTSVTGTSTMTVQPITVVSTSVSTASANPGANSTANVITTEITLTITSVIATPIATIMNSVAPNPSQSPEPVTTAISPIPGTPSCGQVGDFVIGFDDLPSYGVGNNTNSTLSPPIFNPYDHFFWSAGFGYGPPPDEPYVPNSGSELAQYNPADAPPPSQGSSAMLPGSFGAGPRAGNNIYWFDAQYAWVGCNNTGTGLPCDFVATAYRHPADVNGTSVGQETLIKTQHFSPRPCPSKIGCPLTQIYFDAQYFTSLSSMQFYASVNGSQVGYYLDTLALNWFNNSCSAGLTRLDSK